MTEELDPTGAANVFTAQMMALIALAQALVECGAVRSETLIASLKHQMERHRKDGVPASMAVPLAGLIRALRHEQTRRAH